MPVHFGMPHPAITVGELIESLSVLPPDAPIAMTEVTQEWLDSRVVTTMTLKVWGDLEKPNGIGQRTPRRLDCI